MGGCQNYGALLGTLNKCRIIMVIQKGPTILWRARLAIQRNGCARTKHPSNSPRRPTAPIHKDTPKYSSFLGPPEEGPPSLLNCMWNNLKPATAAKHQNNQQQSHPILCLLRNLMIVLAILVAHIAALNPKPYTHSLQPSFRISKSKAFFQLETCQL